jgi:hypothetical protein
MPNCFKASNKSPIGLSCILEEPVKITLIFAIEYWILTTNPIKVVKNLITVPAFPIYISDFDGDVNLSNPPCTSKHVLWHLSFVIDLTFDPPASPCDEARRAGI